MSFALSSTAIHLDGARSNIRRRTQSRLTTFSSLVYGNRITSKGYKTGHKVPVVRVNATTTTTTTPKTESDTNSTILPLVEIASSDNNSQETEPPELAPRPKVIIAGGGIAGLSSAVACMKAGCEVQVFERVTKYRPFGGPIQLAGNALSALEAIDPELGAAVIAKGNLHGDRVNGLLDGRTGDWYIRFDTRSIAQKHGLPLTIVISRYELLDTMAEFLPEGTVNMGREIVSYRHLPGGGVVAELDDGTQVEGDILVGADGIRSKVRAHKNKSWPGFLEDPTYAGFTCYTATCDFPAPDYDTTGYQVWCGLGRYFVSSAIADGRTQWYAFHQTPPGGSPDADMRAALKDIFQGWCPAVLGRIQCTEVGDIERRDIYDRRPTTSWVDNSVCLLGDSCHAMQPNMGQGGGQTFEDSYILGKELMKAIKAGTTDHEALCSCLTSYQNQRVLRASSIMGLSSLASLSLGNTYRRFLGDDPYWFYNAIPGAIDFWAKVQKLNLLHPGCIFGQLSLMATSGIILEYIAAGGLPPLEDRAPYCQVPGLGDLPEAIDDEYFKMKGIPGFAK